ncbi:alpha/beta fold hydrolase [Nonomuraea sp. NPDC001636]|uniref:alpha/beta fold hydrolase n=1 Tax=Nonomuraea sp. NPDC001636 TaxID=3154391 RepID=UPI00332AC5E2
MEEHADALATALRAADVRAARVVAHSMGGTVAVHLAERHPERVAEPVLVDADLDPAEPAPWPGSSGIAAYTEADFVRHGWEETLTRVGPHWAATMRPAGAEGERHGARGRQPRRRPDLGERLEEGRLPRGPRA